MRGIIILKRKFGLEMRLDFLDFRMFGYVFDSEWWEFEMI